jgi:DHA1 family multidrug resistance protein-like MFS transporter
VLFFVLFGCQFALMALAPVMALFVESLGAHGKVLGTTTGAIFAITGLATVLTAPRWGHRSDSRGYRGTLKIALLGSGLFALPQGLVGAPWQLFLARIPYGVFVGGVVPAVHAMISLRAPDARRAGILGITSTALMLGNLMGPLLGGTIAGAFGLRSIFFVSAAVFLAILILLLPAIREPERQESGRAHE